VLDILSSCGLTNVAATMLYHPQPPKERVKPTMLSTLTAILV